MIALCQYNTRAFYAFYYAGIFDTGLSMFESMDNNELLTVSWDACFTRKPSIFQ